MRRHSQWPTSSVRDRHRGRRGFVASLAFVLAIAPALFPSTPAEAAPPAHPGCQVTTTTFTNSTLLAIPDMGTTTSTITVSGLSGFLWDVDLTTFITHTASGDLDITLTSPGGEETVITTDNGALYDNVFNGTRWDDDAGDAVPPGPVTDRVFADGVVATPLVPEGSLGALTEDFAADPNGIWTLSITDDAGADVGTLHLWRLEITTIEGDGGLSGVSGTPGISTGSVPIVDNATATSSLTVVDWDRPMQTAYLTTWIKHTFSGDLTITLTSPAGTEVTVSSRNGGSYDDVFGATRFYDSGSNGPVTDYLFTDGVAADFLVPEEAFAAFSGEDPNGTWVLSVTDGATGDVGSIDKWHLGISSTACDFVPKPGLYGTTNTGKLFSIDLSSGQGTVLYDMHMTATEIACPMPEPEYVHDCFVQEPLPATGGRYMRFEQGWTTRFLGTGASFTGLEYVAGALYGTSITSPGGASMLQIVDPVSGGTTPIGSTGVGPIEGLAYDPNTSVMYGISGGAGPALLYTINMSTGAATVVGAPNIFAGSLEFGPDGYLYAGGVGSDSGQLFRIDPGTGVSTAIGPTWVGSGYGDPVVGLARVTNSPPIAHGEAFTVGFGGTLNGVGLLDNDFDLDADPLTARSASQPSHGTVTLKPDGSFTYTHDGSPTTTDSFTYRAYDGERDSDAATVAITVTGGPPPPPPASGGDTVGLANPGTGEWYLRNSTGAVTSFFFGNPGDVPFVGDWDGDGVATPGLFRTSDAFAYLRNSNSQGIADIRFFFGNPSDVPLAGDFDGDGTDTLSIYRPGEQRFYIINKLGANEGGLGEADYSFLFGNPGDKPVVGDWDGDGIDEVGLHRESTGFFYWRNTLTTGVADGEIFFGDPGDRFVAGDWGTVDGKDTPGLFRPSDQTFYFRHTLTQGVADSQFAWTGAGAGWLPVAGTLGLG